MNTPPSPSPIVVQLVTDAQAPWWAGGLVTGAFVVFAAIIAFVSLRASDRRKLAREDRRQWDLVVKDGYISISASVDRLLDLAKDLPGAEDADDFDSVMHQTTGVLNELKDRSSEWDLIAPMAMQDRLWRLRASARNLYNRMRRGDPTESEQYELIYSRNALRDETKIALRIAVRRAPRRLNAPMMRLRFATFFARISDRLMRRGFVLKEDADPRK